MKRIVGMLAVGAMLAGCGSLVRHLDEENQFLVAAEPIKVNQLVAGCDTSDDAKKRECIAAIASDSRDKCGRFVNSLVLTENTTNTTLDILTTTLSALATVFTPLTTTHGLSAGATISSGSKNAVNSNIYAKASIANYQQAIMATYYKD